MKMREIDERPERLVLGGVVSVKEDGELFATEVVCDVAEGEQRRRLSVFGDAWHAATEPVVSGATTTRDWFKNNRNVI